MKAILQRVSAASVEVAGETVGQIGRGLLVLLGVGQGDTREDLIWLAGKIAQLRIFPDEDGKMNRSVIDLQGEILVVSQFTLYGDCRKGRRPSFVGASDPETANRLYEEMQVELRGYGLKVESGTFQADMDVKLTNQGPVTLILDSRNPT